MSTLVHDETIVELINKEQRRQIEIHKWITSEREHRDRGDEATLEWLEKYAAIFRRWAETLPYTCVHCGSCMGPGPDGLCPTPFGQCRIGHIEKDEAIT